MEPNRILAKSIKRHKDADDQEETKVFLKEHTRDVWDAFENLLKGLTDTDNPIDETLKRAIQIAILCHDFGKVLPAFQLKTLRNNHYKPPYPYHNIPHSLFSIFWMKGEKIKEVLGKDDMTNFIYSAVAFHHWRRDFDEILNWNNEDLYEILDKLCKDREFQCQLEENLKNEFEEFKCDFNAIDFIEFNKEWAMGVINGLSLADYVAPPYKNYFLPKQAELSERQKKNWILISGLLMRCDHFASFCEEENEDTSEIEIPGLDSKLEEEVAKYIKSKSPDSKTSIWQMSKVKDCKDKNVILIAPTGYGKTELAFLWSKGGKLFYTLPIRSAVNQIFERAKSIFTEEKTGLLHSDADIYLMGDGGETESLRIYDFSRQISYPVIVSTGDQFFPYALKPPSYEKIYATMSYSRLVIDEVQAYNPKAAAIIVKFIEDTVRMGGKFLLMTATLPEFVKTRIEQIDKNCHLIDIYSEKEKEFRALKKHKIEIIKISNSEDKDGRLKFDLSEDKITQILDYAKIGKRVLVILNTVKQAQEIYQKLKDKLEKDPNYNSIKDNLWLLHSRFTWSDRESKETNLIKKHFENPKQDNESVPKILVATQVVEASLDIDADILFTEIAPLDALVQRMGRILRRIKHNPKDEVVEYRYNDKAKSAVEFKNYREKYEQPETNVFIWSFENGLESGNGKVYDKDLLLLSLKILKESNNINKPEPQDLEDWLKRNKKDTSEILKDTKISVTLSEYDKYEIVKLLYSSLPNDYTYLREFNKTLDILDAGFMSDRKEEAHKIFREIYDIQLIPPNRLDEFVEEIKRFFKNNTLTKPKYLFSFFKKQVISKFVVSDSSFKHRKDLSVNDWVFYKVIEKFNQNDFEEILEKLGKLYGYSKYKQDDFEKKLRRYLCGIFVLPAQYDENLGIVEEKSKAEEYVKIESTII